MCISKICLEYDFYILHCSCSFLSVAIPFSVQFSLYYDSKCNIRASFSILSNNVRKAQDNRIFICKGVTTLAGKLKVKFKGI